jgi:hypothetical protein
MTNDVFQNKFLALEDLHRLPADLSAHLHAHPELSPWVNRVRELNSALSQLTVPHADKARLAFVDSLTADGPVIKAIPQTERRPGWSWKAILQTVDYRIPAGVAAAALLGLGFWAMTGKPKPPAEIATGPRHELLAKSSIFVAEMAKATTPQARLAAGSQLSQELTREMADLYHVARAEDLDKLAEVYEKVLARGVADAAGKLPRSLPAKERHTLLTGIRDQLALTVADTMAKGAQARQEAVKPLNRMLAAARNAQARVQVLLDGGA